MAINYQTATGQVRLLIADVDESRPVLSDDQIAGYLALRGVPTGTTVGAPVWSVKRAAADALSAIATSEVLVGKVIRSQDLTTDGAKVAAELRAQAQALRAEADVDETNDDTTGGSGYFQAVEFTPYPVWGL